MFAKGIHWDALSHEARRAKPEFLWDQDRESTTYEAILSPLDVACARYFGSYAHASGVRYLLLERVRGIPLWQFGELEAWREAARWLARMHVRVGAHTATNSRAASHLLQYDREFYSCWAPRAQAFSESPGDALQSLAERYERVVESLLRESPVFIHGEFHPDNVLVERRDGDALYDVRPIDWEMAAIGPALIDLACLVAGEWTDEERADVVDAYFAELVRQGAIAPAREHYLKTLDCCLIHLAVRNLGWSRDWSPPPGRDYDWLSEALRLCERWHL